MLLKTRTVSRELSILRSLNARMDLSADDKWHYLKLEKGYQGEVMFDKLTARLDNDLLIINDLCLEFNNTSFQIDTTIITQETIHPFEVKNYQGNYYYDPNTGEFKTIAKKEILSPLDQLKRSKTLLQQLLRSLGVQMTIDGNIIFINPKFTLYQAPLNAPIIYPTQLDDYLNNLNEAPSNLNDRHLKIANKLISTHNNAPYQTKLPPYKYEQQKKGIICNKCYSFMVYDGDKKLSCHKCGCEESADSAIFRSVEEIKLLFPEIKITTDLVFDWCQVINSKKKIRRILKENYVRIGVRQWTYFE